MPTDAFRQLLGDDEEHGSYPFVIDRDPIINHGRRRPVFEIFAYRIFILISSTLNHILFNVKLKCIPL